MATQTPPLNNLIAFDAAARLRSFSKAAEELGITQSAVSQQVQKLRPTWASSSSCAPAAA
jgi:LysR family glycine cleavage system transcriptional activator